MWDEASEEPNLRGVNLDVPPGSLTMIVGPVGSGKSSVLAGLIGQMEKSKGSVAVGGRVAYVAQTAWIINDSVQVGWLTGGVVVTGGGLGLRGGQTVGAAYVAQAAWSPTAFEWGRVGGVEGSGLAAALCGLSARARSLAPCNPVSR